MWCTYPSYSWHVLFLPVQAPSSEPITPSESLHKQETGEEKAERVLAVLQVKSHMCSKMTLFALEGRTLPNGNTTQARENIRLFLFSIFIADSSPSLFSFIHYTHPCRQRRTGFMNRWTLWVAPKGWPHFLLSLSPHPPCWWEGYTHY